MDNDKNEKAKYMAITNTSIWIATSVAVCVGMYFTKSANCLWGFFFPFIATTL